MYVSHRFKCLGQMLLSHRVPPSCGGHWQTSGSCRQLSNTLNHPERRSVIAR